MQLPLRTTGKRGAKAREERLRNVLVGSRWAKDHSLLADAATWGPGGLGCTCVVLSVRVAGKQHSPLESTKY